MAIFTESELNVGYFNPMSILDESVYLSEDESIYDIKMVPVKENSRIGACVVNFEDLDRFAESNGIDYLTAMQAITEENQLGDIPLTVAINEEDIIIDPSIISELANVVIKPISENDENFAYYEAVLEGYIRTGNDEAFDVLLDEDNNMMDLLPDNIAEKLKDMAEPVTSKRATDKNVSDNEKLKAEKPYLFAPGINGFLSKKDNYGIPKFKQSIKSIVNQVYDNPDVLEKVKNKKKHTNIKKFISPIKNISSAITGNDNSSSSNSNSGIINFLNNNKKTIGGTATGILGVGGLAAGIYKWRNQPKSIIAKKIAALRALYHRWMDKASNSKDSGFAARIKKMCAKVMECIDKLLGFLQEKTDRR